MNTYELAGALSNDLFRVANLTHRRSNKAAERFMKEAKKWAKQLELKSIPQYLKGVVKDVANSDNELDLEMAEKYLMYGVLLQNYAQHALAK